MAAMGRVGVVGHVEWISFGRVDEIPGRGEIAHASETWAGAGGGGGVAAQQLAKLAGSCELFTAFGEDDVARWAIEELEGAGVRVHAAPRTGSTRQAVCLVDATGERTITTLGSRLEATGADPLPWELLDGAAAVYFTAGDAEAVRRARAARVLVASTRHLESFVAAGVRPDAVVGSARDRWERYDPDLLADAPPGLVVLTEGAAGGRYVSEDGREGRYDPAPVPGPIADTYGSGDSFQAGLTWALGEGMDVDDALAVAAPHRASSPPPISDDGHASSVAVVAHSSRSSSRNAWISAIVVGPIAAFVPGSVRRSSSSSRRVKAHVSVFGSTP
jgi:ribokinase